MPSPDRKLLRVEPHGCQVVRSLMRQYRDASGEFDLQELRFASLFEAADSKDLYQGHGQPYLVAVDGQIAGLALARHQPAGTGTDNELVALLILRQRRTQGLGTWAATQIFRLHRGSWTFVVRPQEAKALRFIRGLTSRYTQGRYACEETCSMVQGGWVIRFNNLIRNPESERRTGPSQALPFSWASVTTPRGVPVLPPPGEPVSGPDRQALKTPRPGGWAGPPGRPPG